ncbi:MAG: hypothetical protein ABIP46_14310, partial [Polaromonas sp.]
MTPYGKLKAYPFPFKGALWAFWLLAFVPTIWMSVFTCAANPEYFYSGYSALTALVCVWEAHVRWLEIETPGDFRMIFPILKRAIANILILIFFSLVIALPAALFLPAYQCYTDRAKVSELILASSSVRSEVEERVKASGTLEKSG